MDLQREEKVGKVFQIPCQKSGTGHIWCKNAAAGKIYFLSQDQSCLFSYNILYRIAHSIKKIGREQDSEIRETGA
jgi:hypothetical protein